MKKRHIDYEFVNKIGDITVIIEPWAEEILLKCGSKMVLSIYYDVIDNLETELNQKYFVIWLWHTCQAAVFIDGVDQTPDSLAIPAPG